MATTATSEDKSSSSKTPPSKEELDAVMELMSAGKRHYVCQEFQLALESFVSLCQKLVVFYGELADECAEAYLYYGKTLLEIARLENGVLGHAVKETPVLGPADTEEEEEEEEGEAGSQDEEEITVEKRIELRADVEHAMRDGNIYNATEDEETGDDTEAEEESEAKSSKEEKDPKEDSTETKDASGDNKEDEPPSTGDANTEMDVEDDAEEEEEDVSNMQLGWEMFELTVFICLRQLKRGKTDSNITSHLAEAKYGLAQISLETEHYEDAVKDFSECLEYFTDILQDKNDRRLAEVNYNIALALSFDKQFAEAIDKYKVAVTILEARIKDLEAKVKEAEEKGGKGKASSELEDWTKEINELKDLIVLDMLTKIEDAEEMKKQADDSVKAIKEATKEIFNSIGTTNGFDEGFGFDTAANCTEVVHDITNKIRPKRKTEDDSGVEHKKLKTSDEKDTKENVSLAES